MKMIDPFSDPTSTLDPQYNPYVDLLVQGHQRGELPVAYGPALKPMKGAWHSQFNREEPVNQVILEIGAHRGDVLIDMAHAYPDCGFIGMDITFKRVVTAAQRAKKFGLHNTLSILANAENIEHLFLPGELAGVVIFFPDPWMAKARQSKKRLFNQEFCLKINDLVADGGFVWLKTDAQVYFEGAVEFMQQTRFTLATGLSGIPARRFVSCFERQFFQQNIPTYEAVWVKRLTTT